MAAARRIMQEMLLSQMRNMYENVEEDNIECNEEPKPHLDSSLERKITHDIDGSYLLSDSDDRQKFLNTLNKLSWHLFEINYGFGADSINVFSVDVAYLFDSFNLTHYNEIKFDTKVSYVDSGNSFLIGNFNDRFNVYLPKTTTRINLIEKNNIPKKSEQFIKEKHNTIEMFNSNMPDKKITIILHNFK